MSTQIKDALPALAAASIAIGCAYLFGFWGTFHLNPLEYLSFVDVAKLSAYPLAAAIFLVTSISLVRYHFIEQDTEESGVNHLPWGVSAKKFFSPTSLLAIGLVYLLVSEPLKWFYIGGLTATVFLPLAYSPSLKARVPSLFLRYALVVAPVPLMFFAYWLGNNRAIEIRSGEITDLVDLSRSQIPGAKLMPPVVHLGHLGSTHIFYELRSTRTTITPDHDVVISSVSVKR